MKCSAMKNLAIVLVVAHGLVTFASANSCFVCSTRDNPRCLIPEANLLMRDCNILANNNTCYSRIINREVERGCFSSLTREEYVGCNSETSCELCYDPQNQGRCNGAVFPEHRLHCHQCTGSVNGTCGQEIISIAQLCRLYVPDDECYVSVVGDQVERGCLSESDYCRVGRSCHICDGNGCNFKHYEDGAMSVVISLKTLVMALLAAVAYGSFRQ
ncbi:uncharacterized protein LOC129774609 [Toxorhynchites rutilus septentrionalis]|uniref:uncharacterized protein LOC129774609 n=1 Tax=Toxorhynchites rutilus septentrionalis TaxID=329112 RepID=UPI002478E106|nr:uncharacterized protein LOC129774609 [Toxorhynchites rutilus septentrionalis]